MNNKINQNFENWGNSHLGQGYSLDKDEGSYENVVTRWAWKAYKAAHDAQQAIIDRLMLEFCPGEMTQGQIDEWAKHQKAYTGETE